MLLPPTWSTCVLSHTPHSSCCTSCAGWIWMAGGGNGRENAATTWSRNSFSFSWSPWKYFGSPSTIQEGFSTGFNDSHKKDFSSIGWWRTRLWMGKERLAPQASRYISRIFPGFQKQKSGEGKKMVEIPRCILPWWRGWGHPTCAKLYSKSSRWTEKDEDQSCHMTRGANNQNGYVGWILGCSKHLRVYGKLEWSSDLGCFKNWLMNFGGSTFKVQWTIYRSQCKERKLLIGNYTYSWMQQFMDVHNVVLLSPRGRPTCSPENHII